MNLIKTKYVLFTIVIVLIGFSAHSNQITTIKEHGLDLNMVSIPGGYFVMGCENSEGCVRKHSPRHIVDIKAFKMSEAEITFKQWDICVESGGCSHVPDDLGWGRANRPVMKVSWHDITTQFIPWLNKVTGLSFRLPSESEWEYAARANSITKYSWGEEINCSQAQYGYQSGKCGSKEYSVPVKSFKPNAFGLYDMHGNIGELVQDCWNNDYVGAPINGTAWVNRDCTKKVVRGGTWENSPGFLIVYDRYVRGMNDRYSVGGFRLALSN